MPMVKAVKERVQFLPAAHGGIATAKSQRTFTAGTTTAPAP